MANFIDKTYFIGSINIPDSAYSNLTAFIEKHEKEILIDLLGYKLYKEVVAWTGTDAGVIKDLIEGKEYTNDNGDLIKWNGFKNSDKKSLISFYTFFYWQKDKATTLSTTGEKKLRSENSDNANPGQKMAAAWNEFKDLYGPTPQHIPSAYNFLKTNEADYPDWIFTPRGNVNNFDL